MDEKKIEQSFREILAAIGENPERDGLKKTPERMALSYMEYFSGLGKDPKEPMRDTIKSDIDDIIIEKDIDFYSMCEHHLIPFFGKIDIAYIPNGKIIGFGNIIKTFEILASRPQLQERLGDEFANVLMETLKPKGLYIRITAKHLCMTMRGVKKENSKIVTTVSRGIFKEDSSRRIEVLSLLG